MTVEPKNKQCYICAEFTEILFCYVRYMYFVNWLYFTDFVSPIVSLTLLFEALETTSYVFYIIKGFQEVERFFLWLLENKN